MTKVQIGVVLSAVLLVVLIYFGLSTKSSEIRTLEKSRVLTLEQTNADALILDAKETMSEAQLSKVLLLENRLRNVAIDSAKVNIYEQLASEWYQLGFASISGYFAQQIAELINTEDSWAITGTTYAIGIQRATSEKERDFSTGRAITAFENAISLNPDNIQHRVNLALCYTENPPADNPMKGVQLLLELNNSQPESVPVLNALARLAIKTGQYERAVTRLETAVSIEPFNVASVCMLATAYKESGNSIKALEFEKKCGELSQEVN